MGSDGFNSIGNHSDFLRKTPRFPMENWRSCFVFNKLDCYFVGWEYG